MSGERDDDILKPAPGARGATLPLRRERNRPQVSLSSVLSRLAEPSPALERLGLAPAALEAGLKICLARLQKGMTQSQLAEMAGISQPALSHIENGRGADGPSYGTLRQLTQALDIPLLPTVSAPTEGVELTLEAGGGAADTMAVPIVKPLELPDPSKLVPNLFDERLLTEVGRIFAVGRKAGWKGSFRDRWSGCMVALDANQSARLHVKPMTTLMVHGGGPLIAPAHPSMGYRLVTADSGHQAVMIERAGTMMMQNHCSESALVFALPSHGFMKF